jgi:transcriptional regulator GlxA family with amidase domain
VRKDHGAEIANRLGRALVVEPHREGGQAQFVEQPERALPPLWVTLCEVPTAAL